MPFLKTLILLTQYSLQAFDGWWIADLFADQILQRTGAFRTSTHPFYAEIEEIVRMMSWEA